MAGRITGQPLSYAQQLHDLFSAQATELCRFAADHLLCQVFLLLLELLDLFLDSALRDQLVS